MIVERATRDLCVQVETKSKVQKLFTTVAPRQRSTPSATGLYGTGLTTTGSTCEAWDLQRLHLRCLTRLMLCWPSKSGLKIGFHMDGDILRFQRQKGVLTALCKHPQC